MKQLFKHLILFTIISLQNLTVSAQNNKGVTPENNSSSTDIGKTRALIIGVSKYQYIESLQYADKDATEFSRFLSANRFWNVASEDVTLLINENAKCGDIIAELSRIIMVSKPGDRVLFYFSGHGDVETITQFNNGYLLTHDTYKNNYITGAVAVNFLKEVFLTLLNKDVKVFMFTDACRSGNLAGGLKGTEFAATAISSMWKNEIKILSSQPGQLSYEDKKWGNGRGVFSYYLTQGLAGAADENKDSSITLSELENYVGKNVSEATGAKQQPIFEGPNKYSTVVSGIFKSNKPANKPGGNAYLQNFQSFNINADSCAIYYRLFNQAIQSNNLINSGNSASTLYKKLKSCSKEVDIVLRANSKLIAALLDNTQQVVNKSLEDQSTVNKQNLEHGVQLMDEVLQNNDLKIPDTHYKNLRRYLFVLSKINGSTINNDQSLSAYKNVIDSALKAEPDAAYLYNAKGLIDLNLNNIKAATNSFNQASKYSPTWQQPKDNLQVSLGRQQPNKPAKTPKKGAITFGVKGGINYSGIKDTGAVKWDHRFNFHGGVFVNFRVSHKFSIQADVMYSGEGAERSLQGAADKLVLSFDYINLPVLIKFMATEKLSLETGPQIGYLISAKQKASGRTVDVKSSYSTTDISYVAGLGYLITAGLGIQGRWTFGLKSIAKNSSQFSPKNNAGQLGLFYQF